MTPFEHFCEIFPKRGGVLRDRHQAWYWFKQLSDEQQRQAYAAAKKYAECCEETNEFPMNPDRFLKDRIWEDMLQDLAPGMTKRQDRPVDSLVTDDTTREEVKRSHAWDYVASGATVYGKNGKRWSMADAFLQSVGLMESEGLSHEAAVARLLDE